MSGNSKFDDLAVRLGSAAVMAGVGIGAIWLGGYWFLVLICVVVGLMVWEVARITSPEDDRAAQVIGALAGLAVLIATKFPLGFALPVLFLPGLVGGSRFEDSRGIFTFYTAMICVAGFGLYDLRVNFGMVWMFWLAAVVIATDVFGYFGGRLIGGPKFWPKVSPKKTWSGTVAGWVAAALVGVVFAKITPAGPELVGISIALSMASQMGDISESAIKRRGGVKDSSSLIPGHGGLLDRFDGMLAASVMLLLVEQVIDFPPVAL